MDKKQVQEYYSRDDIREKILEVGKNREVVGVFYNGSYSKRPNSVVYPADIDSMIQSGVVELHCSIEHWNNPSTLDERVGWDMILDLDCEKTEHGKIAAGILFKTLNKYGIKNVSLKFTGGTGFHLGIPWASIPKEINYKPAKTLFPDVARKIADFLREQMRDDFRNALVSKYSVEKIAHDIERPLEEILKDDSLDPFEVVDIDPILISSRHLFRMPYSLNKKSFLVSLPLKFSQLSDFKKDDAMPGKVKPALGYLNDAEKNEAELLIVESLDWFSKQKKEEKPKKRIEIAEAVMKEYFPPCINNISHGLKEGKKRSVFILINFLTSAKWNIDMVEEYLLEWNKKNNPPLPDSYIKSQVRYHQDKKPRPPPNCPETVKEGGSKGWYESFGVCQPDHICSKIKNPISYPYFASSKLTSKKSKSRPKKNPVIKEDVDNRI